jgi:hypothetical protein
MSGAQYSCQRGSMLIIPADYLQNVVPAFFDFPSKYGCHVTRTNYYYIHILIFGQ